MLAGCGAGARTVTMTTTTTVTQPQPAATPGPQDATYFGEPVSVSKVDASRYLLVLKPESYLVGVTANVAFAQQQGKACAPLSCPGVEDDRLVVPAGTQNLTFVLPAKATGTVLTGVEYADEDLGRPARGARRRREDAEARRAARLRRVAGGRRRQGDVVRAAVPALAPARRALLEERAQALLSLLARAPLGDPARGLGAVRPLAHESLRPARRLRAG